MATKATIQTVMVRDAGALGTGFVLQVVAKGEQALPKKHKALVIKAAKAALIDAGLKVGSFKVEGEA